MLNEERTAGGPDEGFSRRAAPVRGAGRNAHGVRNYGTAEAQGGEAMRCVSCKHGDTQPGSTTVAVERAGVTILLRHVPAEICQTCGADYISAAAMQHVEAAMDTAIRQGTVVEVREYAA